MPAPFKLALKETTRGRHILEKTKRFDVTLNGKIVEQIVYNMRGYIGNLPTPSGGKLDIGERPLSAFRKAVADLNRDARAAG